VCAAAADAVWAVSHYGGAAAATHLIAAGCGEGVAQAMRWHPSHQDVATAAACATLSLASGGVTGGDTSPACSPGVRVAEGLDFSHIYRIESNSTNPHGYGALISTR
jgi:hypothetical protein